LAKYLRSKRLRVVCASPLQLTNYGILKPEEYVVASLNVSSRGFAAYLLNVALSLPLTVLILALRPKVVLVSVPDSYLVLASYLGCALTGARLIVDVRDPQEEIMVREYRKGLFGAFLEGVQVGQLRHLQERSHCCRSDEEPRRHAGQVDRQACVHGPRWSGPRGLKATRQVRSRERLGLG